MSVVSLYKRNSAIAELNNCRAKLNRCKLQISRLIESNIRLKKLLAEENPALRNPVDVLKHAARYLRANKRHGAVTFLFKKAAEVDEERSGSFRRAALNSKKPVEKAKGLSK